MCWATRKRKRSHLNNSTCLFRKLSRRETGDSSFATCFFFPCLASTSLAPSVFASRAGAAPVRVNYHHSLDKAPLSYLSPWGKTKSQMKNAEGEAVLPQKVWALALKDPSLPHIPPEKKAWDKDDICILFSLFASRFHYFYSCTSILTPLYFPVRLIQEKTGKVCLFEWRIVLHNDSWFYPFSYK